MHSTNTFYYLSFSFCSSKFIEWNQFKLFYCLYFHVVLHKRCDIFIWRLFICLLQLHPRTICDTRDNAKFFFTDQWIFRSNAKQKKEPIPFEFIDLKYQLSIQSLFIRNANDKTWKWINQFFNLILSNLAKSLPTQQCTVNIKYKLTFTGHTRCGSIFILLCDYKKNRLHFKYLFSLYLPLFLKKKLNSSQTADYFDNSYRICNFMCFREPNLENFINLFDDENCLAVCLISFYSHTVR